MFIAILGCYITVHPSGSSCFPVHACAKYCVSLFLFLRQGIRQVDRSFAWKHCHIMVCLDGGVLSDRGAMEGKPLATLSIRCSLAQIIFDAVHCRVQVFNGKDKKDLNEQ
jgi:hypothetical protein